MRYPGGEKANTFLWAPPPFNATRSRPGLTSEAGWPAIAPALYNLSAHDYMAPPLDFEVFFAFPKDHLKQIVQVMLQRGKK